MSTHYTIRLITEDPALAELCQKYWATDDEGAFRYKVADLAGEFGVKKNKLDLIIAGGCEAVSTVVVCTNCQRPYSYSNRSDFQQRTRSPIPWTCDECLQLAAAKKEEARKIAAAAYRQVIVARYGAVERPPVIVHDMSLESAIYLLSFARVYASEDFAFAHAVEPRMGTEILAPTPAMTWDVVLQLYTEKLIFIHSGSPVSAFEGDQAETFYPLQVLWNLPTGMTSDDPKDLVADLETSIRDTDWPEHWLDGRLDLWRKIALHECLQYLKVALEEHGLELNPGEKTHLAFSGLLTSFSVAQIYAMIWRAAKDAAAFMVRSHVPKQHAANTIVGSVQRQGERALAEGWTMTPYKRHWGCPQSKISQVYFNHALKIGDKGFTATPGLEEMA